MPVVGLVLNSLLLLALLVFLLQPRREFRSAPGHSSVYESVFHRADDLHWPKALAGFFILLAWTSIRSGHGLVVAAALLALATHFHPYAISFSLRPRWASVVLIWLALQLKSTTFGFDFLFFRLFRAPDIWSLIRLHILPIS